MKTNVTLQLTARPPISGLPEWVPAAGQYGLVPMLNTLESIKPQIPATVPPGYETTWTFGQHFGGSIEHFVGAALAPDFSQYGALVFAAGGGNSWWGTQVVALDLTDLMHKLVLDASPYALSDAYNTRFRGTDPDWRDYPDHSPVSGHNYTAIQVIPASWGNVGAKGAVVRVANTGAIAMNAHRCDLATPAWQRFADKTFPHTGLAFYPASTRDDLRQVIYFMAASQGGQSKHFILDKNGVLTSASGGIGTQAAVNCIGYAPPPYDVAVSVGNNTTTPPGIRVVRAETWVGQVMNFSGERPTFADPNGEHPEWCPDLNCFLFWHAAAETLYLAHPPTSGDPVTGMWVFEKQVLTKSVTNPPTFVGNAPGGAWSKARWNKALRCLIYKPNAAELHAIRPRGI